MFNSMEKDFKSPVSTISPRGQRVDLVMKSVECCTEKARPNAPRKTGEVGTVAHFPAHTPNPIPSSALSPEFKAAFWAKVKVTDGCWDWQDAPGSGGYGRMRPPGKRAQVRAHRLAYFLHHEVDPGDMLVCHTCDRPICVRPEHLFLGTAADNIADKIAKGRQRNGHQSGSANGNARLSEDDVRAVVERIMLGESNVQISASLPVGHAMVSRIRTGKAWADVSASMGYVPTPSKQAPKSGRTAFRGGS
jgi:hypothetical protein